jgi:hypothetical protein
VRIPIYFLGPIIFLAILVPPSFGRLIENWPYERLFKEADLVVIGIAEGTVQTKDQLKAKGWKAEFIGQETSIFVETTLKGNLKGEKKIKVLHYRLPDGVAVINGPLLVTFRKDALPLKGTINGEAFKAALARPDYMLFLRLRPDGRYEPVSGQIDPVLSVRELNSPDNFFSEFGRK